MRNQKILLLTVIAAAGLSFSCAGGLLPGTEAAPPSPNNTPSSAPVVVNGIRTSYADVVEKTSPAVVQIRMERKQATDTGPMQLPFGDDFFRQFGQPMPNRGPRIERGAGSGVIVNSNGTILTNNHVIDGAEKITVFTSDNKTYEAKIIGTDAPSDLAVIKIEAENLPFLTLGNSDEVRVGDIVLAIGNPLDIGETVTAGIISAKGRRTGLSDGSFEDFLQTDAPINRGNSGGALVNLNGELIGINSQILSPGGSMGGNIGIGFSIPSNMAKSVMEQLLKDGKVHRGMLGVTIQNITEDTAKALELGTTEGVLISGVKAGSAADKAGLKRGDVIKAINGEKIEDTNALRNKVASAQPGTEIKLTIDRSGTAMDVNATLDEFETPNADKNNPNSPSDSPNSDGSGKLGLSLSPITPQIQKQLGLDSTEGLVVSDVDPSGPAAAAGITRGDVILEVNRKAISSAADVKSALADSKDKPVLLLVSRQGQTIYLTVRAQ